MGATTREPDLQLTLPMRDSQKARALKVFKHNILVEADYDLSTIQQKLLHSAIARLDPEKLPEYFNPDSGQPLCIRMMNTEVCQMLDMDRGNFHNRIGDIAKEMSNAPLTIYIASDSRESDEPADNMKPEEILYTHWCQVRVNKRQGWIQLEIPRDVAVLLGNLLYFEGGYTSYKLMPSLEFDCKYSFRFLEFLASPSKMSGRRRMPFKLILKRLGLTDKPSLCKWANFKARVLDPAIKEINESTELTVSYKVKKSGRSVTDIDFTAYKRPAIDVNPEEPAEAEPKEIPKAEPEGVEVPKEVIQVDTDPEVIEGEVVKKPAPVKETGSGKKGFDALRKALG